MPLPVTLTNYNPAQDGVGYWGPFISSAGNVYVVGKANVSAAFGWGVWKATDPTTAFTLTNRGGSTSNSHIMSAYQVGDVIHCIGSGNFSVGYHRYSMATDAWLVSELQLEVTGAVNAGGFVVPRAAGSDVISFHNIPGVTSMSKTYGRIAARRSVGGTAAFGAATQIGLTPLSTALQSESVDAAVLGASDRVHLFWTRDALTVTTSALMHRCVKSTDNLNGTSPATAEQDALGGAGTIVNATSSDPHHSAGQPSVSASGQLMIPHYRGSDGQLGVAVGASADTLSLTDTSMTTQSPLVFAMGATTKALRCGGAQWDGTTKVVSWQDNSTLNKVYDKDTGSGWGTDVTYDSTSGSTADMMSSNVFTRGTDVVLATVFGSPSAGAVKYNEVVLRTTGPATQTTSISPVIFTITPQALVGAATGDASRSITNVSITLTPVAMAAAGSGTVTASITPVTITLTPVTLTQFFPPQSGSITPVTLTLGPQALTTSVSTVTRSITPASITIIPVALTESIGGVSGQIGMVTLTLTPITLVASEGPVNRSGSPVTMTLTPVAITASPGTSATTIGTVSISLTPIALTASEGGVSSSISPVILTETAVAVTASEGTVTASISPVTITLTPVALTKSIGTAPATIGAAVLTLTPIAMTGTGGGGVTTKYGYQNNDPVAIFAPGVDATANYELGIALTVNTACRIVGVRVMTHGLNTRTGRDAKLWGGCNASWTTGTLAKTAAMPDNPTQDTWVNYFFATPYLAAAGERCLVSYDVNGPTKDYCNGTLSSVHNSAITTDDGYVTFPASAPHLKSSGADSFPDSHFSNFGYAVDVIYEFGSGGGSAPTSISPVVITVNPQALTASSVIPGTGVLTPAIFTLTPQPLTKSVGGVTASISPAIFNLTPVALTASEGTVTRSISPVTINLTPVALTKSVGTVGVILTPAVLTVVPVTLTGSGAAPNTATLTPVTITLTPIALTKSVGGVSRSISPVTFTIIPVALTKSLGGISAQIGMVTITLTPVGLTASVGAVIADISPVQMMMLPMALSIAALLGGKVKVWNGIIWVDRPIKVWTGSDWVEKPLKVWTGSTWALA